MNPLRKGAAGILMVGAVLVDSASQIVSMIIDGVIMAAILLVLYINSGSPDEQ